MNDSLRDIQYKEALLKYAESFNLKKNKTKSEQQLTNRKDLYVIYARKSTEDDQRQVQSVEDQIDHCRKYAEQNGLEVVAVVREEKSAKIAGKRLKFQEMLDTIASGTFYNSILAWHPDRLSRNMKESGEILDMLDNDVISDLKFSSYTFNNDTAGKMTLSILFAMAKEFSDKLSDDTKRSIKKKVKEGRYCGSSKRGYYNAKNTDYYRPDETHSIYKEAWSMYLKGESQKKILEFLKVKGEKISSNGLSSFFKDPFYAGIYCYGEQVVDLLSIDNKFQPMISEKDFMQVQKINRGNPRGWRIASDFRPLNDFTICSDCGKFMTAGVSKGKSDRYLSLTCGNSQCKEERRSRGIKPVANTIRAGLVLDFVTSFIEEELTVDKKTYNKARDLYITEKNDIVKEKKIQVKEWKKKLSALGTKEQKISDLLLKTENEDVIGKMSNDMSIILNQKRELEKDIESYNVQIKDYELETEVDFPKYEEFLNFFENVVKVIKNTDDAYLIDQLVKLVFLNTTISDKKVLKYELREPFKSYKSLEILSGVANGT